MTQNSQNILILSSNTGGGHRSAAVALEHSFETLLPGQVMVNISQVLEEAQGFPRYFCQLYNYLLRHRQDLMKYYYAAVNTFRPNEVGWVIRGAVNNGLNLVQKLAPNVIVSVHPMTQHFCAIALKKLGLLKKIPLVTVVTDPCYGFWKGWACQDVQQYYVASEDAHRQLVDYGIDPQRIQIAGMPVHSRFQPVASFDAKSIIRQQFNLSQDKFTVLVNAGWSGGGNVPDIYKALLQSNLDLQVVFLSGSNADLKSHAEYLASQSSVSTQVLGYRDDIHHLMQASDLMVSKTGGLTTFEAFAAGLPILADGKSPMPQEASTLKLVEQTGSGLIITRPEQVVSAVGGLLDSPERYAMMRQSAARNGRPGAADDIASDILTSVSF